jgi:hypothetical protein
MLIPRFTIRWLLLLTTVCGVFFLVVTLAVRGQAWAIAVSMAVACLAVCFLGYAVFFGLAFLVARVVAMLRPAPARDTPFSTAERPPQIIPPEDPD